MCPMEKEESKLTEEVKKMEEVYNIQPPPRTMYDEKVKENFHIYGIASFLYACLYAFCMFRNASGFTYFLFVAGSILFIDFCFKRLEIELKKEGTFYIVGVFLLSLSTFCTDDGRIIFFNRTGVLLLTISLLLSTLYNTKKWNLGKFLGSIIQTIFMPLGHVDRPVIDAIWYCKNKLDKKNSKYLYILLGILIAIPFVVVICLLLTSADAVFRDVTTKFFSGLDVGDVFLIIVMVGLMFFASYSILTFLCKNSIKEEVKDSRKLNPLLGIPVASIITVVYLVFSVIQIVYLFMGDMQLPEGYTYAQYAREGFFQLLAVSILNLIIVLVGLYFFKPNYFLNLVLTLMSLCTFIMIASSAMRMIIYIQYYYLTFLRILVLWSLLVLFLLFVGVILYIFKDNFPLFRYSIIIVTCLYIGLSFSHPDYWIAKVNLEGSKGIRSEFFQGSRYNDYDFLSELNADAAPAMIEWIEEKGYAFDYYHMSRYDIYQKNLESYSEENAALYLSNLKERVGKIGIRNFNFSRYLADNSVRQHIK